jgi:hypothetical protein
VPQSIAQAHAVPPGCPFQQFPFPHRVCISSQPTENNTREKHPEGRRGATKLVSWNESIIQ